MENKALTFIEFWGSYKGEDLSLFGSEKHLSEALARHLRIVQKYYEFVSQPFQPEMITELFSNILPTEGGFWIRDKQGDLRQLVSFVTHKKGYCRVEVRNYFDDKGLVFIVFEFENLKTINDFITYLQGTYFMGCYLQWSEKARKELGL